MRILSEMKGPVRSESWDPGSRGSHLAPRVAKFFLYISGLNFEKIFANEVSSAFPIPPLAKSPADLFGDKVTAPRKIYYPRT